MEKLLPHSRKDAKYDAKNDLRTLNELADLQNCNNTMYFECRKGEDLYMWLSKTPHGPSVKFHLQNIHTTNELRLAGNCLRGSRPFLVFDKNFDSDHWQLLKQMFIHSFGTPKGHRKSKPFYDHLFMFSIVDGRVWFRNYQLLNEKKEMEMVEIGPRFVMNPIKIFGGSFGGPVIYDNPDYVSPNTVRQLKARQSGSKYAHRVQANKERELRLKEEVIPRTEMTEVDEVFKA